MPAVRRLGRFAGRGQQRPEHGRRLPRRRRAGAPGVGSERTSPSEARASARSSASPSSALCCASWRSRSGSSSFPARASATA